jgi:hypothetical protein
MYKLASVALSAALGIAGVALSTTAEAHPTIAVGIGLPGVAVVEPFGYAPAYYAPYAPGPYYWHGRYWRRDYDRDRYEHFHHRGDRDGDRRWDRR